MRYQEPEAGTFADLGSEARSVLAVLVMAALWPERYPDGWVSVGEFAHAGVLLGDRADRESLKAAIRRGLRRLEEADGDLSVEGRRTSERDPLTARVKRDRDRRLPGSSGRRCAAWLLRNGTGLVSPELWRQFCTFKAAGPRSEQERAREMLRQYLREAEAVLGFAALAIPAGSTEGRALRRIGRTIDAGLRRIDRL